MKLLEKLIIINPLEVTGNLGEQKSVRYLELNYNIRDDMVPLEELPQLPPNLEHLNLYIDNDNYDYQDLNLKVLSFCLRLEKIAIRGKNINLLIKDIKNCKSLKYVRFNIIDGSINAAKYLAELPLLTILHIRSPDPSLDNLLRLKHCKELKSVDIHMDNLTSLRFLEHCKSLEYLCIITERDLNVEYLEDCTNLKNLFLGSKSITNYKFLPKLPELENLYLYNDELDPSSIKKLKSKLKRWDGKEITAFRIENAEVFEVELEDTTIMNTPE